MKLILIDTALALAIVGASACTSNGREAAYGTPKTDITQTSTEPGAYGAGSPYYVIAEKRNGDHLLLDVNAADAGKADEVAKKAVHDKKGDAKQVTVRVYASDARPPHAPMKTIEWRADKGFESATVGTSGQR